MMLMGENSADCCLCFPLDCGVKTLFFLTAVALAVLVINIIGMLVAKQWYVLIQVLMIIPIIYTLFYVVKFNSTDNYLNRYKISEGFKYMFIINLVINIILFIVVLTSLDEFFENEDVVNQINRRTPYGYNYQNQPYYQGRLNGPYPTTPTGS